MSYEAFGGLASEKYAAGNNLIHAMTYNNRLQPSEIRLGTSGTSDSIFKLSYIYGTVSSPTDADGSILTGQNNGNVGRIKYTIGGTLQYSQTYQYDGVNRLSYGVEHNNGTLSDPNRAWYQTFAYDRWGNRGMTAASTSSNLNQGGNALGSSDFSSSTNRISKTGYTFDNAGNLTAEPGSKTYSYDGENKMVTAMVSGVTSKYWYDADGRRVKKVVGSTATRFVYNLAGQLIAEYDEGTSSLTKEYAYKGGTLVATVEPTNVVKYATADHLGTPRVWTNSSGGVVSRHDYAPFGEELFAGVGVRTTGTGWLSSAQADGQRKQFTGYERDIETDLDFAQARMCSNKLGRFASVDPIIMEKKRLADPQAINLYTYTRNNPLKYIDPDGEKFKGTDGKEVIIKLEKVNGKEVWVIKSSNASGDLRKLVRLINDSGSKTASSQFNRLNNHATMVNIIIDSTTSRTPQERNDRGATTGEHQPHDKNGPLRFNDETDKFYGKADPSLYDKGAYREATITLFEKKTRELGFTEQGVRDHLVATFGHEAEHDLDPIQVQAGITGTGSNAIWHPDKIGSPNWYGKTIKQEIDDFRKKKL